MRDADYPADPYPGAVPPCSFVHQDGAAHRLDPDPAALSGWSVAGTDLDTWLGTRDAPPAAARVPVLAYGSNRCPSKITWLRDALGLPGPAVVLRARTEGVAAVWAYGLRARDGRRPAVLASAPGVVEQHAVWLATPEQITVLDRCEGRDDRFRLARLHTGGVRTEDGGLVDAPWCYVGHGTIRRPLLIDGAHVRCADLDQDAAVALSGVPGDDGLDAPTVHGAPHPDEWPSALLTYGLLMPGEPSWELVAPYAAGAARAVRVGGTLYDTGQGWPALEIGGGGERVTAPGVLVPLRDPVGLLPRLDEYEGPDYRRVRRTLADGTVCWVYAWVASTAGFRALPAGWPP